MFSKEREQTVIELCQRLVQLQSYSGQEDKVAEELKKAFKELGFDDVAVDKYGNIIGHIKGNKPGKKIVFDGHLDTVPVTNGTEWKYPPFAAEIHDGKIYGRGTSDMKGALAAMVCAASNFSEDTKKDFAGDIFVAGVVHEECFEGVAAREISNRINPDYVVIGEASQLNIKIGQRGRAEIVIETFGVPCHSANPEKGINAVYKMAEVIGEIALRSAGPFAAFICGLFYKNVTKRAGFYSIIAGTVVAAYWIYVLGTPYGLNAMVPGGLVAFAVIFLVSAIDRSMGVKPQPMIELSDK